MDIAELHRLFLALPLVSTDTRQIEEDSIFFALKGPNFNGNAFAKEALEKGARLAIVDEKKHANGNTILFVKDALFALQQLGKYHRSHLNTPVLGITGSNGKTTTKELLSSVLNRKLNTFATKGNLNNHIGVPLSLLSLKKEHEFAIIEMGANHQGEIAVLSEIAAPNYGLITNIGKAHLEGFGGLEGVKKGKGELFDYLRKNNGKVFVNAGQKELLELSENLPAIYYGEAEQSTTRGKVESAFPKLSFSWEREAYHSPIVNTQLIGDYNLSNLLAAVTVGHYFGVEANLINQALEAYVPNNNRSALKKTARGNKLIMDAYNANPTSLQAAIKNFTALPHDEKFFILGDMMELGEDSKKEHENICQLLLESGAKGILVGEIFNSLANEELRKTIGFFKETSLAKPYLLDHQIENNLILLKGSRKMKLEDLAALL